MLQRRETLNQKFADLALLTVLRGLALALRPWPMSWRIRMAGALGRFIGLTSKRRSLAINNLKRAFGSDPGIDRRALLRILDESYRDLARTFVEFLTSPSIDALYFEKHVQVDGDERLKALVAEGRGAVLLTGHFGNWEFLNLMAGVRSYPLAVLARVQKLRRTDAFLNRLRAQKGARVVMRGMDTRSLYRILKSGGLVGILADQDGGPKGVFVPLFGRASSYPRGVGRFSYVTGSPMLPAFVVRTSPTEHRIHIGTEIRVRSGENERDFESRAVADFSLQLQSMVRKHPNQWLWAHRRWKSSPDRDLIILDDGRKGHVNQSSALAARIADRRSRSESISGAQGSAATGTKTIRIEYRSSVSRAALTVYGIVTRGHLWGGMGLLRFALTPSTYRELSTLPADLVISCGSSTEAVNLILSRDCRAKSCYIHKPQFGLKRFTLVLAPEHDRLKAGARTLTTGGALSFVERERLSGLRECARSRAGIGPGDRVAALLVGGPSKLAPWDPAALEKMFFALRESLPGLKLYLFATTSRRTDLPTEQAFDRAFTGNAACPVVVVANRENPKGAYEEILAAADVILVTADSVSMVSEAVSTGKPVGLILGGERSAADPKFGRFLDSQLERGTATAVTLENLGQFVTRTATNATSEEEVSLHRAADLLAA